MNNHDIPNAFLVGRMPYGSNGRNNFRFKGDVLYSYDDVIAIKHGGTLLINSDTFTATSSRHQSAIKRAAPDHVLVPDLTALLDIMQRRDPKEIRQYILRRRSSIGEIERRIEASRSNDMIEVLGRRVQQERNAIKMAARYLPLHEAMGVLSV